MSEAITSSLDAMKLKKISLTFFLALLTGFFFMSPCYAGTDVISEYTTTAGEYNWTVTNTTWVSMAFQASCSGQIEKAIIRSKNSGCSGMVVDIFNATDYQPSGSSLGSDSVAISSTLAWNDFIFDTPIDIVSGQWYTVVGGSVDGSNCFFYGVDSVVSGEFFRTTNSGSTWSSAGTDTSALFSIIGTCSGGSTPTTTVATSTDMILIGQNYISFWLIISSGLIILFLSFISTLLIFKN